MSEVPAFLKPLDERDPDFLRQVMELRAFTEADGALSCKVKSLMSLLADALLAHPEGVAAIADRARAEGASEQEIVETVRMAFMTGGLPALVTALRALKR